MHKVCLMPADPTDLLPVQTATLRHLRIVLTLFILGLVVSGVTAFPLLHETGWLVRIVGAVAAAYPGNAPLAGLAAWIVRVHDGLQTTYAAFPFIAYGTDWLAFGHLTIALFFLGPWLDPVRNVFVLRIGLWACALVLPLAFICGPLRGIPVYWRLVDCSFGVSGFPLLWYCLRLTRRLEALGSIKVPTDGR